MINIKSKIVVISGGAGLMGSHFAELIIKNNGTPIVLDNSEKKILKLQKKLSKYNKEFLIEKIDLTNEKEINRFTRKIIKKFNKVDCLINNIASNKMYDEKNSKLENFSLNNWNNDISLGLTANFLLTKAIVKNMIKVKSGNIINMSSDLGIIAPNQSIYGNKKKPITYSIVKHGIIGFSKYLATYLCKDGIRSNALCPGGIKHKHDKKFVKKLSSLIPLGRMANIADYDGIILYLISDSSKYMTGSVISVDGGRTSW
jgi:NAD(P)-dependent dehydrogenase (short-subunit alcohol dehydrogenase family)